MLVKEIMSEDVVIAQKGSTAKEAADLMVEFDVGSVLVVENHKAIGIVTEKDILKKVIVPEKDPKILKVEDIMTHPLITIGPDTPVEKASELMSHYHIKKLPVVEKGKLVGIVTAMDIITNEPAHIAGLAELILKPTTTIGG